MKIVFLSFYSGHVYRGAETFVDALASQLSKKHEVTVFGSGRPATHKPYHQSQIPFDYNRDLVIQSWSRRFFLDSISLSIARFTVQALKYLNQIQPDIIIPTNGGWQTVLIRVWCWFTKTKMVISGQAGLGFDDRWNLLWRPDAYIALSRRHKDWAKPYFHGKILEVIPNGVNLAIFDRSKQQAAATALLKKWKLKTPVVLCVSGAEPYKRLPATISAMAKLPHATLLVLGGNEETKALGKQILGSRFKQIQVAHDEIAAVYALADVFTLVSDSHEAFGIANLEALASNLPVVVTDDPLRHEIVAEAGLYVANPYHALAYAQKLQQAMDLSWKQKPREQAKKFSWDSISFNYEEVFKRLLVVAHGS